MPKTGKYGLSPEEIQDKILNFITAAGGVTIKDIANHLGYRKTQGLYKYLKALDDKQLICKCAIKEERKVWDNPFNPNPIIRVGYMAEV